ncbi:hypothetical protein ACFXPT_01530, partial [Streptomyces goshikiensis]|uniref:hypothetical protein n=1 Tax=Streptomyces goshikiensis TaxID=1942 RepID=UPI00369F5A02
MARAFLAYVPLLSAVLAVGRQAEFSTGLTARSPGYCGASGRGPSQAVAETWSQRRPGAAAPRGPAAPAPAVPKRKSCTRQTKT